MAWTLCLEPLNAMSWIMLLLCYVIFMVCELISNFYGFIIFFKIYCRIHVSAFWEKWRIGVSPYRVPVSVSAYPCNIGTRCSFELEASADSTWWSIGPAPWFLWCRECTRDTTQTIVYLYREPTLPVKTTENHLHRLFSFFNPCAITWTLPEISGPCITCTTSHFVKTVLLCIHTYIYAYWVNCSSD